MEKLKCMWENLNRDYDEFVLKYLDESTSISAEEMSIMKQKQARLFELENEIFSKITIV